MKYLILLTLAIVSLNANAGYRPKSTFKQGPEYLRESRCSLKHNEVCVLWNSLTDNPQYSKLVGDKVVTDQDLKAVYLATKQAESDAKVSEKNGAMLLKQKLKLTEPDLTPAQIKRIFRYLLRNLK